MRHESFYKAGSFSAPELGMLAGWVAHENSFASGQVFQNGAKDIALIFSGECFIEAGARARLKQQGRRAFANDGECLIQLVRTGGQVSGRSERAVQRIADRPAAKEGVFVQRPLRDERYTGMRPGRRFILRARPRRCCESCRNCVNLIRRASRNFWRWAARWIGSRCSAASRCCRVVHGGLSNRESTTGKLIFHPLSGSSNR